MSVVSCTINLDWHIKPNWEMASWRKKQPVPGIRLRKSQANSNQALIELDQLRTSQQVITDPDAMEAVERMIVQAIDKIAALMTALKIQQAVDLSNYAKKPRNWFATYRKNLKNRADAWCLSRSAEGRLSKWPHRILAARILPQQKIFIVHSAP